MRRILLNTALAATVAAPLLASAADATTYCPRVLHRATRLIIVAVPTMDQTKATMRTFERKSPAASWKLDTEAEPVVVGARGIAWGHPFVSYAKRDEPIKREGDQRTPAGLYRLAATFSFAKEDRAGHLQLTPGQHVCVHDASSPQYGRIVAKSAAGGKASGEEMATSPLYRRGIVVDYPPRRSAKAGSCIFLHVWGGEGVGTSGCVGLPEPRIAYLQDWAKGRHTVIAIVAEDGATRFQGCLPSASRVSAGATPPLPDRKRSGKASDGPRAELTR